MAHAEFSQYTRHELLLGKTKTHALAGGRGVRLSHFGNCNGGVAFDTTITRTLGMSQHRHTSTTLPSTTCPRFKQKKQTRLATNAQRQGSDAKGIQPRGQKPEETKQGRAGGRVVDISHFGKKQSPLRREHHTFLHAIHQTSSHHTTRPRGSHPSNGQKALQMTSKGAVQRTLATSGKRYERLPYAQWFPAGEKRSRKDRQRYQPRFYRAATLYARG